METTWKPNAKVAAAAFAAIVTWLGQLLTGVDVPPGIEGAVAVVIAYLIPSTSRVPLDDEAGHGPAGNLVGLLVVVVLVIVLVKLVAGL